MPDPFTSLLSGGASGAASSVFSLLTGDFMGSEDSAEGTNISDQGTEIIQQIGENAESSEDIPAALDGLEMEITSNGETMSKRFENSD